MSVLGVGIVGCGNISASYLSLAPLFSGIEIRGVADIDPAAARSRSDEHGVPAHDVAGLLDAPGIDIVVNLTAPAAHFEVSRAALEAGKHVYSEKPFVLAVEEGRRLRDIASARDLRVGSAPDTWLGGAHQLAREIVDDGRIGRIVAGTCHVMSAGMEDWHPNPDFFFQPGAGPMLDVGPYYVANLVQLLGPVRRVAALSSSASPTRTILSEPRRGETIPVGTPTNIHALLDFACGATVTLSASWDVRAHRHGPMELYGTDGSLYVPDPNFFGGIVTLAGPDGTEEQIEGDLHPFGVANVEKRSGFMADYRSAGLADMASAILEGRPHRAALDLALHSVDVMTAILRSGESGTFETIETSCERPAPLDAAAARTLLAGAGTASS